MPTPPSTGAVTSPYGPRTLNVPGVGPFHYGADRGGQGNVSPEDGVIAFALYSGVFGNIIGVRSGDVVWNIAHHAHLNGRRAGHRVAEGEYLAPLGSTGLATGPHSHTERRVGGRDAIQSGTHTDPEQHYSAPAPAGGKGTPLPTPTPATESEEDDMPINIRRESTWVSYTLIPGYGITAHANEHGFRLTTYANTGRWPGTDLSSEQRMAVGERNLNDDNLRWLLNMHDLVWVAEDLNNRLPEPGEFRYCEKLQKIHDAAGTAKATVDASAVSKQLADVLAPLLTKGSSPSQVADELARRLQG